MPPPLRSFDPSEWGWCGPHYVEGYIVTGYHEACNRYLHERVQWCDEHPNFDWLADIIRRYPDEPWGTSAPHLLPKRQV